MPEVAALPCGDGVTQDFEECDLGDGNAETASCTPYCQLNVCGDGMVNAGVEECDNGNANGDHASCTANCMVNVCGDGHVLTDVEDCDDANSDNNDLCPNDCIVAVCGDGVLEGLEVCDDGNRNDDDDCPNDCRPAVCGDGSVEGHETCDDGNLTDGDGCDSNCTPTDCGNGIMTGAESCDDGNLTNGDGCDSNCTPTGCGNGVPEGLEACDDGNAIDGDGCDVNCTVTACGNGITAGSEGCDDGDSDNFDACPNDCTAAVCGDGVWEGSEECDDGNAYPKDDCLNTCFAAKCGDGVVHDGAEECDDGDSDNFDTCPNDCTAAVCGDGTTESSETCDDSNTVSDDGCDSDCTPTAVTQLAAGSAHNCVLLRSGAVRCWGWNKYGQLGYGHTRNIGDDESPASAGNVDVGAPVAKLVTGAFHTCALLDGDSSTAGRVRCWGGNLDGQLGYGNTTYIGDNELPSAAGLVDLGGTAVDIAAGGSHTCAIMTGRTSVRCWGSGTDGELGYGTGVDVGDNELPSTQTALSFSYVSQLALGANHSCVRIGTAVRCWGFGENGELGYGYPWGSNVPGGDVYLSTNILTNLVSSGAASHTCAVMGSGGWTRCWGLNSTGQLGLGNIENIGDDETAAYADPWNIGNGPVDALSLGGAHTCALSGNEVRCWGEASDGALGYGDTIDRGHVPQYVPDNIGPVDIGAVPVDIETGGAHSCVITETGTLRCWGSNQLGQIGFPGLLRAGTTIATTPRILGDVPLW